MWYLPVVIIICLLAKVSTGLDLSFPPGFKFGAATAAYQVEGAWNVSDKAPSIWDVYTHEKQDQFLDGASGDVACDSYHLWETDIEIAANLSLDFYRFSISWPRLIPNGFPTAYNISEDGKNYYNNLIDGLLAKGIEPVVTIFHFDLPQRLQDLGGWTNPYVAEWFADYADIVYSLYADRVKTWITLNEPVSFNDVTYMSNSVLRHAPGIYEPKVAPFIGAKNILIAHAKAYRIFDEKYRPKFGGKVSLSNHVLWFEGETEDDAELGDLTMEFTVGRYSHPIFSKRGGWPSSIEKIVAENSKEEGYATSRMPNFTQEEIELIKGTFDFYALNHYTSRIVRKAKPGDSLAYPFSGMEEIGVKVDSRPEWKPASSAWILENPDGLRQSLAWVKKKYGDIPILITENGYSSHGSDLEDDGRVQYFRDYMEQVLLSIHEDGVNVIGFTAWSMMDNFEWADGYSSKFGLYEVDFTDPGRARTPRKSARFYADVIKNRSLDVASKYLIQN